MTRHSAPPPTKMTKMMRRFAPPAPNQNGQSDHHVAGLDGSSFPAHCNAACIPSTLGGFFRRNWGNPDPANMAPYLSIEVEILQHFNASKVQEKISLWETMSAGSGGRNPKAKLGARRVPVESDVWNSDGTVACRCLWWVAGSTGGSRTVGVRSFGLTSC